jgi:hypothetical protein
MEPISALPIVISIITFMIAAAFDDYYKYNRSDSMFSAFLIVTRLPKIVMAVSLAMVIYWGILPLFIMTTM